MDPSSTIFERLLIELHIIGQILPGQKLATQQGILQIQSTDAHSIAGKCASAFIRYWYGENRNRMVDHIKQVIQQTIHLLLHSHGTTTTSSATSSSATSMTSHDRRMQWGQESLVSALKKARHGLENLKSTYAADAALVAQIEVLVLSIDQPLTLFERAERADVVESSPFLPSHP